jgi:hypothetical protein
MSEDDDADEFATPGWEAIDEALNRLYPEIEPLHFGTMIKWRLGGPDPLDGISIYRRDDHWHYVTYGMSELYEKESELADQSGWGFEFTFRLAFRPGQADSEKPPMWAMNLMQNLARYVFSSGNPFASGHHLDLNGPIALDRPDTEIRALAFAEDPELGHIDTPNGSVQFLQLVGLTLDEYDVVQQWNAERLLAALEPKLPMLVTDLARTSLTGDPAVAEAIAEGVRRDGSSTGSLFVQEAGWRTDGDRTVITFGATAAKRIAQVLPGRLPHGRGLAVDAPEGGVLFRPTDAPDDELSVTEAENGYAEVRLPEAAAADLAATLRPVAGEYPVSDALVIEVVKSQIRDQDGNVVQEIG